MKNKLTLLGIAMSGLLAVTAQAQAQQATTVAGGSSTFTLNGSELVEKFDDNFEVRYSKLTALDSACNGKAPAAITEKHSAQPPANIQGYWKNKESAGKGTDDMGSSSIHIRATGQLDTYISFDGKCEAFVMGELNGNKLTLDMPDPVNVETHAVVLNTLGNQLLWTTVDGYTTDGKTSKSASAWLLDKSGSAVPANCKLAEKLPKTQKSTNNPSAAVVGTWKAPAMGSVIAEGGKNTDYQELFVVTAEGYLATASIFDNQCEAKYIGETVGNTYTK